jgi:hypothetical protein
MQKEVYARGSLGGDTTRPEVVYTSTENSQRRYPSVSMVNAVHFVTMRTSRYPLSVSSRRMSCRFCTYACKASDRFLP